MADHRNTTAPVKPHRKRLQDLLRQVIACAAKEASEESPADVMRDHDTATNLFIELANQMLMSMERGVVSAALLAAAGSFAHFTATKSYTRPLEERHVRVVQKHVAWHMRDCAEHERAARRLN